MGNLIIVGVALLTSWFVLFWWIPWLAKRGALFGLHGLRDRLYRARRKFPKAMDTLIYRDVEYIVSVYIHLIRDRTYIEAGRVWKRVQSRESEPHQGFTRNYDDEITSIYYTPNNDGRRALSEVISVFGGIDYFIILYLIGGHPAALVATLMLLPFVLIYVVCQRLLRALNTSPEPTERIPSMVQRLHSASM